MQYLTPEQIKRCLDATKPTKEDIIFDRLIFGATVFMGAIGVLCQIALWYTN